MSCQSPRANCLKLDMDDQKAEDGGQETEERTSTDCACEAGFQSRSLEDPLLSTAS